MLYIVFVQRLAGKSGPQQPTQQAQSAASPTTATTAAATTVAAVSSTVTAGPPGSRSDSPSGGAYLDNGRAVAARIKKEDGAVWILGVIRKFLQEKLKYIYMHCIQCSIYVRTFFYIE